MNDETIEAARAELEAIREEVREDLAAELGGDPDEYRAEGLFDDSASDESDHVLSDGGE